MNDWTRLTSEPINGREAATFVRTVLALFSTGGRGHDDAEEVDETIATAQAHAQRLKDADDRSWGEAVAGVIGDLVQQGWVLEFRKQHLWGQRPLSRMPRDMLRQRLLVRRNEQLLKPSVREFVQKMERWRLYRGTRTSILSLMRDGKALVDEFAGGARTRRLGRSVPSIRDR